MFKKSFSSTILIATVILMTLVFAMKYALVEANWMEYYNSFYKLYRWIWSMLTDWILFPIIYIWIVGIIGICCWIYIKYKGVNNAWIERLKLYSALLLVHVSYFYIAWGFNYEKVNLVTRWQLQGTVTDSMFIDELTDLICRVNELSFSSSNAATLIERFDRIHDSIRVHANALFLELGLASNQPVNCKLLFPRGLLYAFGAAGVYWPFSGESYVDAAEHPLQIPFTVAHELCHGLSWTDEGECNLLGYLICLRSIDPMVHYAAEIALLRYMLAELRLRDTELYQKSVERLNSIVKADLKDIRERILSYPQFFPECRDYLYDLFLKSNGVVQGNRSYSQFVTWVLLLKQRHFKAI